MANALAVTPAALQTMSQAELLAKLTGAAGTFSNNLDSFMNFDGKAGKFTVPSGTDEPDTYPLGSEVQVNILDAKRGASCWKKGGVIDKVERSIFEAAIDVDSLEDHGPYSTEQNAREGWGEYALLPVRDSKTGKQYKLRLSSVSARDAFGRLINEITAQATLHDLRAETPVIKLGSESFKAKGQKNYKPKFELVRWDKNPEQAAIAAPAAVEAETDEPEAVVTKIPASRKK